MSDIRARCFCGCCDHAAALASYRPPPEPKAAPPEPAALLALRALVAAVRASPCRHVANEPPTCPTCVALEAAEHVLSTAEAERHGLAEAAAVVAGHLEDALVRLGSLEADLRR